jgi:hypothetical protein
MRSTSGSARHDGLFAALCAPSGSKPAAADPYFSDQPLASQPAIHGNQRDITG